MNPSLNTGLEWSANHCATSHVWNSFHSVPVREEDRHKLTFITPWGRFRYLVAPQGYFASGDGYTLRFADITEGIENKRSLVDDTRME